VSYDLSNDFKRRQFEADVAQHLENRDYVTLARVAKPRSTNQNRYLHALLGLLSVYTGFTLEEIKSIAKRKFAGKYTKDGVNFIRETKNMNKEEMTTFIEKLRLWGIQDIGCPMPTVEEWQSNWKAINEQINQFKLGQ